MNILAIETSCDETAISILNIEGNASDSPVIIAKAEVVVSQLELHREWGGVVPNLARREHQRALVPVLVEALEKASMKKPATSPVSEEKLFAIKEILSREEELFELIRDHIVQIEKPPISSIAVTAGPGLEMALWVGVNAARALGVLWDIPVVPTNHMEGHFLSALTKSPYEFPVLGLLVSGGHTELVLSENWLEYKLLGSTQDDAVGESFDKVARMLKLPYPGGPEISKMAARFDTLTSPRGIALPQPMKNSGDLNFSYSGLKTAALYEIKKHAELTEDLTIEIAHAFEVAAVGELVDKTRKALTEHSPAMLVVGGGVSANQRLQNKLEKLIAEEFPHVKLLLPTRFLSTDNATMIGIAGYLEQTIAKKEVAASEKITVHGTWPLAS